MTTEDDRSDRIAMRLGMVEENNTMVTRLLDTVQQQTAAAKAMPRWRYFRRRAVLRAARRDMDAAHTLHEVSEKLLIENWLDLAIGRLAMQIEDLLPGTGKSNLVRDLVPETLGETDAT
jgi:hypothetical protein